MDDVSRRSFLKHSAVGAVGAGLLMDGGWLSHSRAATSDYFSNEFGVSDALC